MQTPWHFLPTAEMGTAQQEIPVATTYCGDRDVSLETVEAVLKELYQLASSYVDLHGCIGPEELGKAVYQLESHCANRMKS